MKYLIAVVLLLAGCAHGTMKAVDREPVDAHCDKMCFDECKVGGIPWEGDPLDPKTWDALTEVVLPGLKDQIKECNTQRRACVKCLNNLEEHKAINK